MPSPRILLVLLAFATTCAAASASGWDRQKAFDYLEARQQEWAEWKPAQKHGGPCVSCHTGLSYLLARRVIGENQPRPVERAIVEGVRTRVLATPPKTMLNDAGAEAILNLLTLALQRRDGHRDDKAPLDPAEQLAMKRLWENQLQEGEAKGSWSWFMHDLHPVESEHSTFYAATLAELALSAYPVDAPARVEAMRGFLDRHSPGQPLHNRLARIAFTSKKDPEAQARVLSDLWKAQAQDGGWTTAALGPWARHEDAPPDSGSNAYATAWAAFAARQSGAACHEPGLQRALAWLGKHQDPSTGAWKAVSMNKVYPAGSTQSKFMTDAATGYAAAALLSCAKRD